MADRSMEHFRELSRRVLMKYPSGNDWMIHPKVVTMTSLQSGFPAGAVAHIGALVLPTALKLSNSVMDYITSNSADLSFS